MSLRSKKELRPIISKAEVRENMSETEQFQNGVLRPILKLQHHLIVLFFNNFTVKSKSKFDDFSKDKKIEFIQNSITKNQALKNQYIGLVTGLLTLDEFKDYLKNSNEYNKRILKMIGQRIESTL